MGWTDQHRGQKSRGMGMHWLARPRAELKDTELHHLLLSKQHRKRNPPRPKWEEQLSFLFLRCYQELWKVYFKSILKVPLTISLSTAVQQISKC